METKGTNIQEKSCSWILPHRKHKKAWLRDFRLCWIIKLTGNPIGVAIVTGGVSASVCWWAQPWFPQLELVHAELWEDRDGERTFNYLTGDTLRLTDDCCLNDVFAALMLHVTQLFFMPTRLRCPHSWHIQLIMMHILLLLCSHHLLGFIIESLEILWLVHGWCEVWLVLHDLHHQQQRQWKLCF